jgi:hypothetical protein
MLKGDEEPSSVDQSARRRVKKKKKTGLGVGKENQPTTPKSSRTVGAAGAAWWE